PGDQEAETQEGLTRINPYKRGGARTDGEEEPRPRRLTYDQFQKRQQEMNEVKEKAKKIGSALAELDPTQGVATSATYQPVGDQYRYLIDEKVNLNRQKAAMLPILDQDVEGSRVSIFNASINNKFPLLGLRFKNTTGQPL